MPDMGRMWESAEESREIRLVTARLVEQFEQPQIEREISSAVGSEFKWFDGARVRAFVPLFVERRLRESLRALDRAS